MVKILIIKCQRVGLVIGPVALISHRLATPSKPPAASQRPSGLNSTALMAFPWLISVLEIGSVPDISQRWAEPSWLPVASQRPSGTVIERLDRAGSTRQAERLRSYGLFCQIPEASGVIHTGGCQPVTVGTDGD